VEENKHLEKITDLSQVTYKFYHIMLNRENLTMYNAKDHIKEQSINYIFYYYHLKTFKVEKILEINRGRCGLDRLVVWFSTTFAISAYHH
jgi:hypothetical protein